LKRVSQFPIAYLLRKEGDKNLPFGQLGDLCRLHCQVSMALELHLIAQLPYSQHQLDEIFKSCTLILPTISTGNTPQLAIDCLLSTYLNNSYNNARDKPSCIKLGFLRSDHIIPCIGLDALKPTESSYNGEIHTELELFYDAQHELVLFQQRSPLLTGANKLFALQLIDFIQTKQFKSVVVLTSVPNVEQSDAELNSYYRKFVHYYSNFAFNDESKSEKPLANKAFSKCNQINDALKQLNWSPVDVQMYDEKAAESSKFYNQIHEFNGDFDEIEPKSASETNKSSRNVLNSSTDIKSLQLTELPFVAAGGIGRWLFALGLIRDIELLFITVYTTDSDNAAESIELAHELNDFFHLLHEKPSANSAASFAPLSCGQHIVKQISPAVSSILVDEAAESSASVSSNCPPVWFTPNSWRFVFGPPAAKNIYL
jgi:hypothetical protein